MSGCACSQDKDRATEALKAYFMGRGQKRAGMCPTGVLEGCSALWGSSKVEVAPGAKATITWSTVGVFFSAFAPLGLILNVNSRGRNAAFDAAGGSFTQTLRECCLDDLIEINAIRYQGDNRLSSPDPINLSTFRCCNVCLGVSCLGIIEPSANDLEVDVTSVIDTGSPAGQAGLALEVTGTLIGWEVRGSRIYSALGPCPTEPEDAAKTGFLPGFIPPGTTVDARFTARVPSGGGGGGGATPGSAPPVP